MTMAALEATLTGPQVPVAAALSADGAFLARRAQQVSATLASAGVDARAVPSQAVVGGGGAPGVTLPSAAVSLPERLAGPLRSSDAVHNGAHPAVIGRAEGGRLLLDLRAVPAKDDEALAAAVIAAAAIAAVRPTAEPGAAVAESQRVAD
jgi:L-seryl-tRNA(Ser) seleniumtransferase